MKKLLVSLFTVLLFGCVQVPMTTLLIPTPNGMMTVKAPKDSKIIGLKANVDKGTISLDSYEARMNPDVVSASAAGQAELIKAYGDLANSMAQLGLRALATSQGMPLASTQPPPATAAAVPQTATISGDQLNAIIQKRAQELANAKIAEAATNRAAVRNPRTRHPAISTNAPAITPQR